MSETIPQFTPDQAASHQEAQAAQAQQLLSRAALEGVGVATQHFYGADEHTVGRGWDGWYTVDVTRNDAQGNAQSETVGSGANQEMALHDSLKQMRTLETVKVRPLVRIEMTDEASVDFTALAHYAPRIAPSREAYPIPRHLEGLLVSEARADDATYQNTIEQEGWQDEIRAIVDGYVSTDAAGQELLKNLNIRSLSHLTPEQAVKLSIAFVQNVSKYSYGDVGTTEATRADTATAQELLTEGIAHKDDPNWEGNGVCRNITSNVKAVFESLKATQGELSMLRNTYAVYSHGLAGDGYDDKRDDMARASMSGAGHAWNTFVTIDQKGSAVATIVDATWALGKDMDTVFGHLDRTDMRAASQITALYERSERKPEALEGIAAYFDALTYPSAKTRHLSAEQRKTLKEFAVTEYLKAAAQLDEIPQDHSMPTTLLDAAHKMSGRLESQEIATLFRLDKADGSRQAQSGRLQALIKGFDGNRVVGLAPWKSAENLVFDDDDLQELAYAAVGEKRTADHAEESGKFRLRMRGLHPELLPPFDASRAADARELRYIASLSAIHDRTPKGIMQTMSRNLKKLAGDEAVYGAIVAGRSDYDLAVNYQAITTALRSR